MVRAERLLALVAGLAILGLGGWWTSRYGSAHPLTRYGFEYLQHLGPGEAGIYARFIVAGVTGGGLVAWGLAPLLDRVLAARTVSPRRSALGLALAASLGVAVVGAAALRSTVVTDDEFVYLFQSRALALGRAALVPPPLPEFWVNAFVQAQDGRWFGQYPPGHPLALLPGVAAGFPRAVPILLAGCTLLLAVSLFRRLAGILWGTVAAGLLLVSPLFVLTGATLLSHSTALFAFALAAWGLADLTERDRQRAGWALGIGLGLLVVTRPWTGATLGGVLGVAALALAWRRRRRAPVLPALLSFLAFCAFFLVYNSGATGNALTTGYAAIRGPERVELGFGTVVAGMPPHTPARGLVNVARLALRFGVWAWGAPLLWLLLAVPAGGDRHARETSTIRAAVPLAWALLVLGLGGYVAYWSIGVTDTGPVKTYELLLPAGALVAVGLDRTARRFGRGLAAGIVVAAALTSWGTFWPDRVAHLRALTERIELPYREVARAVEPPAIVFVANVQPRPGWSWVFGRPNPRPGLDDPVLYVRDGGTANPELVRSFPGRRPYRLDFNGTVPVVTPLFRAVR